MWKLGTSTGARIGNVPAKAYQINKIGQCVMKEFLASHKPQDTSLFTFKGHVSPFVGSPGNGGPYPGYAVEEPAKGFKRHT